MTDTPSGETPPDEGRRLIHLGVAIFLVSCVVLFVLAWYLAPKSTGVPRFAPTRSATPHSDGTFVATLDFSDRDAWRGFDFGAGAMADPASADLVGRRHVLHAPHGAIDLGDVPLAGAHVASDAPWVMDVVHEDTAENAALRHWYAYSNWTHILRPRPTTFAVRRADGGIAYLRIQSYYCAPEGAGCFTVEYRLE